MKMRAPTITVRARKPWYRSKVLWINVAAVVLLAAEQQLGVLQAVLPGNVYAWAAFFLPIVNALIRMRNLQLAVQPHHGDEA